VDGCEGWGEAYGPPEVAKAAIDTFFTPLLLGRDIRERESLWHLMFARSVDYGQKGIMIAAISAIDIALWDIAARAAELPLYRFLGAAEQTSIPCYATGFYFTSEKVDEIAKSFADEAACLVDRGFRAVKLKIGLGVENDLRLIKAVRDAVPKSTRVMMDANHAYNSTTAIHVGRRAEEHDISWFEEPVSPLDVEGYRAVRREISIPVAGGECEYTRFGFASLFQAQCLDFAQPDLCACGGITEALKIATLASLRSVHVTPHAWGTSIGQAAALHFYAAQINNPATLVPEEKWIECDQSENRLRDEIVRDPIRLENGCWVLPQTPGLGVEVERSRFAKFTDRASGNGTETRKIYTNSVS